MLLLVREMDEGNLYTQRDFVTHSTNRAYEKIDTYEFKYFKIYKLFEDRKPELFEFKICNPVFAKPFEKVQRSPGMHNLSLFTFKKL